MENTEEIYQALEEFSKKKHKLIPRELDEYLHFVARTGDPVYQWGLIKQLFKEKFLCVITDYYETSPGIDIPSCPNVDVFNYETMKNSLLEKIDGFGAAPFTIQRICELLTSPRKQYSRIDKFMRAFEKNILVVSTRDPGHVRHSESEIDNSDPREPLVNGSDNSDYNVDVDMDDMTSWKQNADSTETYAVHHTTNIPATDKSEEYSMHNGPAHREIGTAETVDSAKEEDDEKDPQPSTSNGEEEEKMDEEETDKEKSKESAFGSDSPNEDLESGDDNKTSEHEEEVDVDKIGETNVAESVQEPMEGDEGAADAESEDKPQKSPTSTITDEEELQKVEEDNRKIEEDDRNMDTGEQQGEEGPTPAGGGTLPAADSDGETEHINVDVEEQSKMQDEVVGGSDSKEAVSSPDEVCNSEEQEASPSVGSVSEDDKTSSGDEASAGQDSEVQPSPTQTTSSEEVLNDKVSQSPEGAKPVEDEEAKKEDIEEKKETTEVTTLTASSTAPAPAPACESSGEDEKEKDEAKETEGPSDVSKEIS